MRKMAEVVHKILGEDATNLLFQTVGDNLASQGGQLSHQTLIMNPAITLSDQCSHHDLHSIHHDQTDYSDHQQM
ncbi:hypothetical protein [Endozoicomonas sp. 8E]|uniref:hypothetical protein n=1 Tax=Endozoicomonas sp. 8E TaxID=3035692 RepID=UPI002938D418|nr:hypothetical protein [Endozoicomonas sp. 8E]WOG30235.1 hypothetical protein P6910_11515 [Endozoicomonas sp. 8E]